MVIQVYSGGPTDDDVQWPPAELTTTLWRKAPERLRLAGSRVFAIQAIEQSIVSWPAYIKDASVNRGTHVLHFGGEYDSHLLVPKV